MPVLKYIGDHERDFPGIGVFKPGAEIDADGDTGRILLASGYFIKLKTKTKEEKKEGDN